MGFAEDEICKHFLAWNIPSRAIKGKTDNDILRRVTSPTATWRILVGYAPNSGTIWVIYPRSGRYRGGVRDRAQPVIGDDSSQKGHCNHLRQQKPQSGGVQRHNAPTERDRRSLLVCVELEFGPIWRRGASNESCRKCPGVAPAAGESSSKDPRHFTQTKRAILDCDVYTVGKYQQLANPKTTNQTASRPFHRCYGGLMGAFTPVAVSGYKYDSNITDEYTKWTAVYLLTNKHQVLQSLQAFVDSTVIRFG